MIELLVSAALATVYASVAVPDMSKYGPDDAVVAVFIDAKALRSSPHRRHYTHLVKAMPDYLRVVGESTADPVEVYDRVMVASANPRKLTETVLVASTSRSDDDVVKLLDEVTKESLDWKRSSGVLQAKPSSAWWARAGDPRVYMRGGKGSVAFADPKYAKWFARSLKRGRKRGFPPPLQGAILAADVRGFGIGMGAGLPRPQRARVTLHDGTRPELKMLLSFASDAEATTFLESWPGAQRELVQHWELAVLGYTALIARIEAKAADGGVLMTVRAEPKEVERLSKFLATTIRNRTKSYRKPRGR